MSVCVCLCVCLCVCACVCVCVFYVCLGVSELYKILSNAQMINYKMNKKY